MRDWKENRIGKRYEKEDNVNRENMNENEITEVRRINVQDVMKIKVKVKKRIE